MNSIDSIGQRQAMVRKLERRTSCEGKVSFPAVPGMVDDYVHRCAQMFAAIGRRFDAAEQAQMRKILKDQIQVAFGHSQRSTIVVSYRAEISGALNYVVTPQHASLEKTYERWVDTRQPPFFGIEPDAKVMAVAQELGDASATRVLDIGAGTGRNALALGRKGHPVDAVELTKKFAEVLAQTAQAQEINLKVICKDVFEAQDELHGQYRLILVSEVLSDFRSTAQLRSLFALAAQLLEVNGVLLLNSFVATPHYAPDEAAREFGQQVYSMFFTREEFNEAASRLPLILISDESVFEYESAHLPAGAWPHTNWYPHWVSGQDLFDLPRPENPIELRWLSFKKVRP